MNADSKLRFPTKFGKGERVVELEGEAYFQVVHNEDAPFIVKTSQMAIKVLGTEFNVSAYAEDSVIRTTLVRKSAGKAWFFIPGNSRLSTGEIIPCW